MLSTSLRTIPTTIGLTAALLAGGLASAAPAFADSQRDQQGSTTRAADAVPPPCVSADPDDPGVFYQSVTVHNGCAATERVKVIGKFVPDSGCLIISSGDSTTYKLITSAPYVDGFDGLRAC